MNEILIRAHIGASHRVARARQALAARATNENGEVNIIFLVAAAVVVLVGIGIAYQFVIKPSLDTAQGCADQISNLGVGGTYNPDDVAC